MKVVITGAEGLLGWHCAARLHAQNCAAVYKREAQPFELALLNHANFDDNSSLDDAIKNADAVLHWAGVNRGEDALVEAANPAIAKRLIASCERTHTNPHIIYANSTHATSDSPYGRSKRMAHKLLEEFATGCYTNFILPHIFGECAKPYYNNVTATLIDKIWLAETPEINPQGHVQLLHAGKAAQTAIDAIMNKTTGTITGTGTDISITSLWAKLKEFHNLYTSNIFPDLSNPFDLALFNSYRTGGFPKHYPFILKVNKDQRGKLFESAKGGNASHTFLSTTVPGEIRGNHFHYDLVERFLVVSGDAIIRIRKVLSNDIYEFRVSGDTPVAIDQIPFHTHNIENIGKHDAITFFWTHRMFDPNQPDTYADKV